MANKLLKYFQSLSRSKPKTSQPQPPTEKTGPIKHLQKLSLFKDTPEAVLSNIARKSKMRDLAKGDILARQGAPSDSLFIIRRGWVKIVAEGSGGEEVVLNQCGPGQVIGEMSLLDQKPRSNTMVAISNANVLEVQYEVVLETLQEYPQLSLSFLRDMSDRLRFANAYIEETIIWSQHIAAGDYDFVKSQVEETQSTIVDISLSDQARASAFLSAFFKMVEGVRQREENLMQQVHQLKIEIDEARRQEAVKELTETDFFEHLQAEAQKLREERKTKIRKQTEQDKAQEE
jgi:CRP-like cAMP-binding protein